MIEALLDLTQDFGAFAPVRGLVCLLMGSIKTLSEAVIQVS